MPKRNYMFLFINGNYKGIICVSYLNNHEQPDQAELSLIDNN